MYKSLTQPVIVCVACMQVIPCEAGDLEMAGVVSTQMGDRT